MLVKLDLYIDIDCTGASPDVVSDVARQYALLILQKKGIIDTKFNGKIGAILTKATGGTCSGMTLLAKDKAMDVLFEGLKKSKNKKKSDFSISFTKDKRRK